VDNFVQRSTEQQVPMPLNYERVIAFRPPEIRVSYGSRECILYALGIGLGLDPLDRGQLKFVYEGAGLTAFPTMAAVLGWPGRLTNPDFGIDETRVVAGDLKVALHQPLAAQGCFLSRARVREVIDKGPGNAAIVLNTRDLVAEDGTVVATVDSSTFARGHGGFGGPVKEGPRPAAVPDCAPDLICDLPTSPNLALLYRLNGDDNPLHADPERAELAGFERPILHGAASFGIAAHAILRTCAAYDAERLATIEARFSRPIFPGETIRTEIWRSRQLISFRCRVVERDALVLSNGLALLRS
jgi:acyl dehydratase